MAGEWLVGCRRREDRNEGGAVYACNSPSGALCLSVWVETAVASKKGIAFLEDKIRGECKEMGKNDTGVVKGVREPVSRAGPPSLRADVAE